MNISFNIGKAAAEIDEIVVRNIPPHFYKWRARVERDNQVIMYPYVDMRKVHDLWKDRRCPIILDCQNSDNDKHPNQPY